MFASAHPRRVSWTPVACFGSFRPVLIATMALIAFGCLADVSAQQIEFKPSKRKSLGGSLSGRLGSSPADADDPVTVSATFKVHAESSTGTLAVTAKIQPTWHINSITQPPGAVPTKISLGDGSTVELAGSFKPDREPHSVKLPVGTIAEQHEGSVTWTAPIRLETGSDPEDVKLPIKFYYQACANQCLLPTTATVDASYDGELNEPSVAMVPTRDSNDSAPSDDVVVEGEIREHVRTHEEIAEMASHYNPESKINYVPLYEKAETTLFTAIIGAFVGGFLLNLMPCVFPVLGIKVMGFVEQAGSSAAKVRLHGLAFTAGLVVSMWALAGFILFVKLSLGQEVNWGQQMGSPYFVAAIIVLLFLMGLNMAGVFEFGTSMTRLGGTVQNKKGYSASFLSGILTTLIATPCSGPFLGAAMGYTLAQPPGIAMLLFTVLALGIAAPYLLLSMFPAFINALPRPGAWMETFKVTMAFLIFAAVAFFMRTFGGQTGVEGLSWLLMGLVVIGLAAYFYGHYGQPHLTMKTRRIGGIVVPLAIACAGVWLIGAAAANVNDSVDHGAFVEWTPGIVEYQTSQNNRPVLVDYTAEWCATCQVNEQRVFTNELVKQKLNRLGVLIVAADMTITDESQEITADLARADRSTISTYLLYPANYPAEPAILMEELISPDDVLKALKRITPKEKPQVAGKSTNERVVAGM